MEDKIRTFGYFSAKGEMSRRKIYVIHEDDYGIAGFDVNDLTPDELDMVHKVFDDKAITPMPARGGHKSPMDYDSLGISKDVFTRAYRNFLKSRML